MNLVPGAEAQRLKDAHAHRVEKQEQEIEACKREIEILGAAAIERDEVLAKHQALEAETQQLRARLQQLEEQQRRANEASDMKLSRKSSWFSMLSKISVIIALTAFAVAATAAVLSICSEEAPSATAAVGAHQQPHGGSVWDALWRRRGGSKAEAGGLSPAEKRRGWGVCDSWAKGLGHRLVTGEYVQAGMLVATGLVIGTALCHVVR